MNYNNPPSVIVSLIPYIWDDGLIMIRRNLPDGKGKLALPGGYQNEREDWKTAGIREVKEETGIELNPDFYELLDIRTSVNANVNLIFCLYIGNIGLIDFTSLEYDRNENQEVTTVREPVETAFPYHTELVKRFFDERLYKTEEWYLHDYEINGY